MIAIQPISPKSQDAFFERTWIEYRKDILKAGMSPETADRNIEQTKSHVFTDEKLNPNQYIFDVINDGETVGVLWLVDQNETNPGSWYIYDIEMREEHRGKGFGRQTMVAAEEFIRSRGGISMGLNVFGFNTAARKLYQSLDYEETAIQMKKVLK